MKDRPLTQNIRAGEPLDIGEYEKAGGYASLRKAIKMTPKDVETEVLNSTLLGRGGAGYEAGRKWSAMLSGHIGRRPRYLVINADEMEPGTMKDRTLMEGVPHLLVEGAIVSSYAVEADIAYIFLRWEYKRSEKRLRKAVAEAYERGYIGKNILGSSYSLELYLHTSAGRYMCGEAEGMLNALEGKRAIPRAKPPHAAESGLWGKPTVINNVETICAVPGIVNNGHEWFLKLSHTSEGGTKLYGVSGRVKNPGVWELPMGTTAREIIEEHAGGMKDGYKLRGWLPGGASTAWLTDKYLDEKMDFQTMKKAGSALGTGTIIVLDDKTCPVGATFSLESFFARESCGWCTPCREGLPWVATILNALEEGRGEASDVAILEDHVKWLQPHYTFCALAPAAALPLGGLLKHFRDDIDRHITGKRCPWR